MIGLLVLSLAIAPVRADPGRTLAGLTVGLASGSQRATSLRAHADYGLWPHLTLRGELGWLAGAGMVSAGGGPQIDLVDSTWWRVGLTAGPELVLSSGEGGAPGWPLAEVPVGLVARSGLRVDWLLFWGLCLSGRADRVWADATLIPSRSGSWWESGLGLSVRL